MKTKSYETTVPSTVRVEGALYENKQHILFTLDVFFCLLSNHHGSINERMRRIHLRAENAMKCNYTRMKKYCRITVDPITVKFNTNRMEYKKSNISINIIFIITRYI